MVRYFLDIEFSRFENGELLSLALVRDGDHPLYLVQPKERIDFLRAMGQLDPWVDENVIPILFDLPPEVQPAVWSLKKWPQIISDYLYMMRGDEVPQIICDWPSDLRDLCNLFITGPGEAVPMSHQTHFTILRHLDVFPTSLKGAVQHNAVWDAMALQRWLEEMEAK